VEWPEKRCYIGLVAIGVQEQAEDILVPLLLRNCLTDAIKCHNCLERGADCLHVVQLMPLHHKTPSSLASFKSRQFLPFWHRLIRIILEKRPLSGCRSSINCNNGYVCGDFNLASPLA